MVERTVEITTPDGVADGHFYTPAESGAWPSVIMLTDVFGSRPQTQAMASRLAQDGFAVLLANPYYRMGKDVEAPKRSDPDFMQKLGPFLAHVSPDRVRTDVRTYMDWLEAQPQTRGAIHGIVGYCMSGSQALRSAADFPDRIVAAASFHGAGLATDAPDSPHTRLGEIKAAVLIGHAVDDATMPAAAIARLDEALAATSLDYESETYPAAHGWCVPGMPAYNEAVADEAWSKMVALFKRRLG